MIRTFRLSARLAAALCISASAFSGVAATTVKKSLEEYAQPALRDLSASIVILSHNDRELKKIGKDYPQAYTLSSQEIQCKEPYQVRFQGKKGFLTFRTITNGTRKLTEATGIPLLRQRKSEDISRKPGKADVIADLGIVTPAWVEHVESEWVRTETRDGKPLEVFDVSYKGDRGSRHTFWIDGSNNTIVEHIHHNRERHAPGFRKRLLYADVRQFAGVWLPTRVTMYNTDNRQAAEMRYDHIRVNTGLADRLFSW